MPASHTDAAGDAGLRSLSQREPVELGPRTLVRLQQQGEIRSFRGFLRWAGDLEAQRLDVDPQAPGSAEQAQDGW